MPEQKREEKAAKIDEEAKEHIELLVEKTERIVDHVGDLVIFKKIRRMGAHNKKFFVLVVASAMILYWRGLWALYDLFFEYMLPNNRITAAVISVVIGALILVGTGKLLDTLVPVEVRIDEKIVEINEPAKSQQGRLEERKN